MPDLTAKQEAFAVAYVETGNGSEALVAADAASHYGRTPRGYYVYVLVNPLTDRVFYVGKGKGNRMHHHLRDARKARVSGTMKSRAIAEIMRLGAEPSALWIEDSLPEDVALRCEAALIRRIGRSELANAVWGKQHHLVHQFERLMGIRANLKLVVPAEKRASLEKLHEEIAETANWLIRLMQDQGLDYAGRASERL